jgi:hypothetical protein
VSWTPPSGFLRPRVDTLTSAGKAASLARSAAEAGGGDHPTREDADRSLQLVEELVSAEAGALFARALEVVWSTTRNLAEAPGAFGLIHAIFTTKTSCSTAVRRMQSTSTTAAGDFTSTTWRSRSRSSSAGHDTPSSGMRCSRLMRRSVRCRRITRPTSKVCSSCAGCSCSCGFSSHERTLRFGIGGRDRHAKSWMQSPQPSAADRASRTFIA